MLKPDFDRARDFICSNARLLERHLFRYHFEGGSSENVQRALEAYRHKSGLFGFGLEPDKRTSDPQPVDQQIALGILECIGAEKHHFLSVCDRLSLLSNADGGLPFSHPTVSSAPHAPWWECERMQASSVNPTGCTMACLFRGGVSHKWMIKAEEFCWQALGDLQPACPHSILNALAFLEAHPDRSRTQTYLPRMRELVREATCFDPNTEHYVFSPMIFAPDPEGLAASFFTSAEIQPHLKHMLKQQQEDGGWPINWLPISEGVHCECRGIVTLRNLRVLEAYGLLEFGNRLHELPA